MSMHYLTRGFFLTLIHLCLGLLEQDLAYRFGISQPSLLGLTSCFEVERSIIMASKSTDKKETSFKSKYPTTRVNTGCH